MDDVEDISLVKDCLVREGQKMIENQYRPTEPTASLLTTDASGDSERKSVSEQYCIKKCKLSSWLKEATEVQSSSSTP